MERNKDDLLFSLTKKDFEIRTFRVGGNGGQKVNKTSSGVEIVHHASGARGRCTDTRSQLQNKKIALKRLTETKEFKLWLKMTTWNLKSDAQIEEEVDRELADPTITKVEYIEN